MDARTKRRLERLRDDLAESDDLFGNFSFGIISSTPETPLIDPQSWQFLERPIAFRETEAVNQRFSAKPGPYSFDPFDDGKRCIFWNGNAKGVEAYKDWLNRLGAFLIYQDGLLSLQQDVNPNQESQKRGPHGIRVIPKKPLENEVYHRTLATFWSLAESEPKFADSICAWDIDNKRIRRASLPVPLKKQKTLPTFVMQEPTMRAAEYGEMMIDYLLGQLPRPPRLTKDDATKTVTLDGETYNIAEDDFLILKVLIKAGGIPLTATQIKEKEQLLEGGTRFDRRIANVRERYGKIGALIMSRQRKPAGYWIDEEFLK